MVDAGELREPVALLRPGRDGEWGQWPAYRRTWAKAADETRNTIFSSMGMSARTKLFTLRGPEPRQGEVILWRGRWHYVTATEEVERGWWRATTAVVTAVPCQSLPEGRPFLGFLAEPYVHYDRPAEPYAANTERRVLVTAKNVLLQPGQLVSVSGEPWPIRAAHLLDLVMNEYEIKRVVEL